MKKLPALLARLFPSAKPLAVFDRNTHRAAYPKFGAALPEVPACILADDEIHADERQIDLVTQALRDGGHDLLWRSVPALSAMLSGMSLSNRSFHSSWFQLPQVWMVSFPIPQR